MLLYMDLASRSFVTCNLRDVSGLGCRVAFGCEVGSVMGGRIKSMGSGSESRSGSSLRFQWSERLWVPLGFNGRFSSHVAWPGSGLSCLTHCKDGLRKGSYIRSKSRQRLNILAGVSLGLAPSLAQVCVWVFLGLCLLRICPHRQKARSERAVG